MKCTKCNREIPVDTKPSENWEYYCADCGLKEVLREIEESKKFFAELYNDKNKLAS